MLDFILLTNSAVICSLLVIGMFVQSHLSVELHQLKALSPGNIETEA